MIKRPLHPQFSDAVRQGRKITTIRDKAWPIWVPIMLYNWSGKPYRSKHVDVTPIIVEETTAIRIGRERDQMFYHAENHIHPDHFLWCGEGFLSAEDMDDWFRRKVKPGQWIQPALMRFRLFNTP